MKITPNIVDGTETFPDVDSTAAALNVGGYTNKYAHARVIAHPGIIDTFYKALCLTRGDALTPTTRTTAVYSRVWTSLLAGWWTTAGQLLITT
jgi:hypothetical protein